MKQSRYEVPTKVLLAQARATLDELAAEATAERRGELARAGLNASRFKTQLSEATGGLEEVEAAQERQKAEVRQEDRETAAVAEEGYRYKLVLEAKVRAYIAEHGEGEELRDKLRFGALRVPRARSVAYELRIVLPELEAEMTRLRAVGINQAFVARGKDILRRLDGERRESKAALEEQKAITAAVLAGEMLVSRLLAQLVAADEAVALEDPQKGPVFRLELIAAERGRQRAAKQERVAAAKVLVPEDV